MNRHVGKVAVVTGASSGIGAAISKLLAENGMIVVGIARRANKLQELADTTDGDIRPRVCDLKNEEEILAAFRWIEDTLGGVDVLVNNAAVCKLVPLVDGDTKGWSDVLSVNVQALNICTREALRSMRKRGDDGYIIHINSIAGHIVPAYPTMAIGMYTATKHAVTSLCESLRIELQALKSNIKISSISPGAVDTAMLKSILKSENVIEGQEGDQPIPEDVLLVPKDVAELVEVILTRRPNVQIQDIIVQPLGQKYA